ncbi:MAG: hypothetical protein WA510_01130, partial [Acidobacteriaceae bacterium]
THIVLFASGLVAAALLRHGSAYVTPFAPAEQIRAFCAQSPTALRVGNFFLLGSAVPLGIFTVTVVSLLQYLGVRAAGTQIAQFGGLTAAFSLFLSGMTGWILSVSEVTVSASVVKAMLFFSFLSGGAMYAIGFGLLAAGVSITCYFMRLLPRWMTVFGMLIAVAGELSWFSLITYPANFFIPVTRFAGFLWMLLASLALTKAGKAARVEG